MGRRSDIDWEKVEQLYRIGSMTTMEIATTCGVADSSIRLKAKQLGWSRDLTDTVRTATKAALIADSKARSEKMGIDIGRALGEKSAAGMESAVASQVVENVVVLRRHMDASVTSQELKDLMKVELMDQTRNQGDFVSLGELLDASGPDANGRWKADKRNEAYLKAISLPQRALTLKTLVDIESKINDTQRQALNIDGNEREESSFETLLQKVHDERAQQLGY